MRAISRDARGRPAQRRCTRCEILDTPAEERFDRLTRLAAALFDTPISTVTLIDADRQWHKACIGVGGREDAARGVVLLGGDREARSR